MPWKRLTEDSLFDSPRFRIGAVLVLVLAITGILLFPTAKLRFEGWSAGGALKEAEDLYARRDYKRAILEARKAMDNKSAEVEAIRIIARSMEALGDPGAIEWRRRLGAIKPGDMENTLAWANAAIKESDIPTAENLLADLKPEDRKGAAYHDIAAWIALGERDAAGAEAHWKEAVRLEPTEDKYVQRLWTLHLSSPAPGARSRALAGLEKLAQKRETRGAALRTILDDALKHGESAKAREIANSLGNAPNAPLSDRLTQLRALQTSAPISTLLTTARCCRRCGMRSATGHRRRHETRVTSR